jgi:hypothetical protein
VGGWEVEELTLWTPITPLLAWAALAAAIDDIAIS